MAMIDVRILVVEHESIIAKSLENKLKRLGYTVSATASSGKEALRRAAEIQPGLVLMDIKLPGDMDGVETAEQIRARFDIPVVYLIAYADDETLQRAKITDPSSYVLKPFEAGELHSAIEIALYRHEMDKKLKESETRYHTLMENIPIGIYHSTPDPKGRFLMANPAFLSLFGFDSEEELEQTAMADLYLDPSERKSVTTQATPPRAQGIKGVPVKAP